ncbi:hypothetical protein IF2G_04679 [Cordyceps javanica]|nr:hypothetical protein IF2G_04679 [Cordyceps javanica]
MITPWSPRSGIRHHEATRMGPPRRTGRIFLVPNRFDYRAKNHMTGESVRHGQLSGSFKLRAAPTITIAAWRSVRYDWASRRVGRVLLSQSLVG